MKKEKIVQTAGRNQLNNFSPMFAHLNDDVLFGEVWNEKALSVKTQCIITVVALMSSGITDSSLQYHLQNAKNNGVSKEEIAAIITHTTMYTGWPRGWAVFRLAMQVIAHSRNPQNELAVTCCNLAELYDRQDPEDPRARRVSGHICKYGIIWYNR